MGSHPEKSKDRRKMLKLKMAASFGRKLIISASILLRKPCLGSKLGYISDGLEFCYVFSEQPKVGSHIRIYVEIFAFTCFGL